MKKIFTKMILVLAFFLGVMNATSIAQSPRMQLFEYFDNTSIPPFGAVDNAHFDSLADANTDKLIFIKYHVYWGSQNYTDPMNLQDSGQSQMRVNYYNLMSDPWAIQDGARPVDSTFNDVSVNLTQSFINHRDSTLSPFTISVSHTLNSAHDTIFTHTVITKTDTANNAMAAYVIIIEKLIHFATAPGISGDTLFRNVMKQILPVDTGTTVPSMNIGDSMVLNLSWKLENVYDINQLAVVSFVQDKDTATREVYQAGYSAPIGTGIAIINKPHEAIIIYPNPATTLLSIHQSSPSPNQQLIITDLLGNEIYKEQLIGIDNSISIANYSNGLYFYEVRSENSSTRGKFVVQK